MRPGIAGADWWFDYDGPDITLQIRVARMSSRLREIMLMEHEITEALICWHTGVTVKQVDEYDMKFDREHPESGGLEAGDMKDCPYKMEHNFASVPERMLCGIFNDCWQDYNDEIGNFKVESGEPNA